MNLDKETELIYLLAILPEGAEAVQRITKRVIDFRDNTPPEVKELLKELEYETRCEKCNKVISTL